MADTRSTPEVLVTSSTLTRPTTATPAVEDCAQLVVEIGEPGTTLDALAKVVTMLRGRRWDVRAVDADLDAGVVRLSVRTDRAELLVGQLQRVVVVGSVSQG
ncbi:hypothetical protein EV383_1360 [Pseudonocardia sediminis]|uniref:Uncharacterized protein n=1 Tax=Pseudonocardia sediminis TaxID=1397368 RepID=A0A4Q7URN9_PSEST|nr:hypothetical protein [Pseudonocardia sediminis]RZT84517.1 hypothetical protein EV383_1360 [Pseudonocardia sediminis]